ncbi:MAG TPA: STAS domain-containing protein [Candidatus Krumholzibacteria bacterium]|nr:STAS domain-containing protein [Candidatus Krumholzibacteria bacterium]HRX51482.1 STAS domain-containing protein [Candidatus Krumholzibacteria bacterium]
MSDALSLRHDVRDGVTVLTVSGTLDAVTSTAFRERCLALLPDAAGGLVVDIAAVPFVASSGLGTFLLVSEKARTMGRPVVVSGANRNVRDVLAMMNLVRFLKLQPDVESALAEIAAASPA